jgi:hypothetical protein
MCRLHHQAAAMGLVEPRLLHLHQVFWHPSLHWRAYYQGEAVRRVCVVLGSTFACAAWVVELRKDDGMRT